MVELPSFQKIQKQITAYIRDPEHHAPPENIAIDRLDVYKELFFNNLLEIFRNAFPVCGEILTEKQLKTLTRGFFKDYRTNSPYFQDIPKAFLDYLTELKTLDQYPPFFYELAHYEWVELALSILNTETDEFINPEGDLLTEHPVLSETAWVLQYNYPVHQIGKSFQPTQQPAESTFLIAYRSSDNKVQFMQISLLTAHLINLLLQDGNLSSKAALLKLADAAHAKDKDSFIKEGLNDLITLQRHSIILGTRRVS